VRLATCLRHNAITRAQIETSELVGQWHEFCWQPYDDCTVP